MPSVSRRSFAFLCDSAVSCAAEEVYQQGFKCYEQVSLLSSLSCCVRPSVRPSFCLSVSQSRVPSSVCSPAHHVAAFRREGDRQRQRQRQGQRQRDRETEAASLRLTRRHGNGKCGRKSRSRRVGAKASSEARLVQTQVARLPCKTRSLHPSLPPSLLPTFPPSLPLALSQARARAHTLARTSCKTRSAIVCVCVYVRACTCVRACVRVLTRTSPLQNEAL